MNYTPKQLQIMNFIRDYRSGPPNTLHSLIADSVSTGTFCMTNLPVVNVHPAYFRMGIVAFVVIVHSWRVAAVRLLSVVRDKEVLVSRSVGHELHQPYCSGA